MVFSSASYYFKNKSCAESHLLSGGKRVLAHLSPSGLPCLRRSPPFFAWLGNFPVLQSSPSAIIWMPLTFTSSWDMAMAGRKKRNRDVRKSFMMMLRKWQEVIAGGWCWSLRLRLRWFWTFCAMCENWCWERVQKIPADMHLMHETKTQTYTFHD